MNWYYAIESFIEIQLDGGVLLMLGLDPGWWDILITNPIIPC